MYKVLSLRCYLKIRTVFRLGYLPNIDEAITFNEKIINKKINYDISNYSKFADKFHVRSIINESGYGHILNEVYQVFDDHSKFDFENLPKDFVMKANHGSGMVKIVKDKNRQSKNELIKISKKWLNINYNKSVGGTDFHYDYIKPEILIEKLLENDDLSPLMDYKFFCFSGKVEFISVVDNSKGLPLTYVYNTSWEQMPFSLYNRRIRGNIEKPGPLKDMIRISEDLSKNFDFVRIDLYLLDNKQIIFGEYTFFPGGGMLKFNPGKFDRYYGSILRLT